MSCYYRLATGCLLASYMHAVYVNCCQDNLFAERMQLEARFTQGMSHHAEAALYGRDCAACTILL